MIVGNDVVDLRAAANQPSAIHPRFDGRAFSAAELLLLASCDGPATRHRLRWTLWAARESALKLFRKRDPTLPFHPSEFEVRLRDGGCAATVSLQDRVAHVRLDVDADRVHAIATAGERSAPLFVAGTSPVDASASPAVVSVRAREFAARAVADLLNPAGSDEAAGTVTISGRRSSSAAGRIPRARRGGAPLPVDVSLSHDGGWLAHAIVRSGIVLTLIASLAGCSDSTSPDRDLELAQARWVERGPVRYSYVFDQSCFCGFTGPVRLTVRDGDVIAARSLPGSSDPDTVQDPAWFPTIDELFTRLHSAVESDAVVFLVEYDTALGYPASASVDVSEQIADEEFAFEVSDVTPE